ncbi:UPF0175 family protein [Alkalinema pantanalense CENA528]|uniref:UPF0175 family protein n=1 Tax=Alkalinema pantanalense TaxID=1620705 RepID=UPI003D6F8AF1
MSLIISDDFLRMAHISETDLKLEIAILLFQQKKITLGAASQFAGMNPLEFQQMLGSRKIPIHYGSEDLQQDFIALQQDLIALQTKGIAPTEAQSSQAEILQRIEQRRTFSPAQHNLPDTLTLLQEDRIR